MVAFVGFSGIIYGSDLRYLWQRLLVLVVLFMAAIFVIYGSDLRYLWRRLLVLVVLFMAAFIGFSDIVVIVVL